MIVLKFLGIAALVLAGGAALFLGMIAMLAKTFEELGEKDLSDEDAAARREIERWRDGR